MPVLLRMEGVCSDNVLTEIEENLQDIVKDDEESIEKLDDEELLEEFDVVDSWEVDGDDGSRKSDRRSRGSSYSRRRNDRSSRRDSSHDNYRSRRSTYKRPRSRSNSRSRDLRDHRRLSKRLSDVKSDGRHSAERLKESPVGSLQKVEKLPDLKCTTSVETGEVNVVLLTENKNVLVPPGEKEPIVDDESQKKSPLLLKNPFALARLKRKRSLSADKSRVRDTTLSPRHKTEKHRREPRVVGVRNKDRSLSPYRPRSKHRSSPSLRDRRSIRRSISLSPERHESRRVSGRRNREGGRWHGRSREGSVLSRVSSRSSLSFISSDEMSPRDHNRKRSPLRAKGWKTRGLTINNENFMSSSADFDQKLSLLLKEGKQKQSFANDSSACAPVAYSSGSWRPAEWTNTNPSQVPNNNYSCDVSVKPDYSVNPNNYSGYPQEQYNQATYYGSNQPTNFASGYAGDAANPIQPPYNYGNQYQNQIPNQFYPQMPVAPVSVPTSYTNPPNVAPFQPVDQLLTPPVPTEVVPPLMANTGHQSYPISGDHMNYHGVHPQQMNTQESIHPETPVNQPSRDVTERNKYSRSRERVPTRTNIPLTSEENIVKEEDPMRTPPPPVIADTWREIESGGKQLSSLLEESNRKRGVILRCEEMLRNILSNDPKMEQFKITPCENLQHFSVRVDPKSTFDSRTRTAARAAKWAMKKKRYQSPLLRKETNPWLKFAPWLPGEAEVGIEHEGYEISGQSRVQVQKSMSSPVQERMCASCVNKRESMASTSTQTENVSTNEVAVQVEEDWNHYYPNSNYKNNNSSYSAWYR
ncbi:uncharacterized protein LOC124153493 [Ischnura elegans]|uniref:uncharacterized protein LOC124153493 n=1 Tax=Ischnura elegans TaxID=197161 RepID=UPI001ED89280|nr:uncharacterized protein LOC124153493 [Ischnura elegans]